MTSNSRLAATLAVLCALGVIAAPYAPAAAAVPGPASPAQVAVIPQDMPTSEAADQVIVAGSTGFLHQFDFGTQFLWTSYGSGHTVQVSALAGRNPGTIRSAGGDAVVLQLSSTTVSELDLADMTTQQWQVPAGDSPSRAFGDFALVSTQPAGQITWAILNLDTQVTTPISGLPVGAAIGAPVGDASAAVLSYHDASGYHFGLLDLASATFAPIPDSDLAFQEPVLSQDSAALYDPASQTVQVYSRAGLADGSDTSAVSVTLPAATKGYLVALAGDHLLAASAQGECRYCVYGTAPALDVPLTGAGAGQAGQALAQAQTGFGSIAQAPGGAALVVGGTGPGDWSVRRLTVDGSDNLVDTATLPLTGPLSNGGLSISQGMVRHIEAEPVPGGVPSYLMFNHILVANSGPDWSDPPVDGGVLTSPLPCAASAACARTADSNFYGTSYISPGTSAGTIDLRQQMAYDGSSTAMSLPSADGTVTDASIDYVIVDGTGPAAQYLVYPGYEKVVSSGPVTGAALWFDTLWRSDGPGSIQPWYLSVDTMGTAGTPIATGSACTPTEIQATQRWIYWSCGSSGPAGVYDLASHTDVTVPDGPMLLGDGYLVQHDAATGNLNLYDIHTDAVQGPVTLANVPAGPATDDRGITWAVDKYSGDVAYVADDDSVHVIDTGVPATPPAVTNPLTSEGRGGMLGFGTNGGWSSFLELSRPITGWTLTIRALSTGQVVHTETGGPSRLNAGPQWNGYLADGNKAFSGRYSWSVTVTTADGAPPVTFNGGIITVFCGQLPFRSYDCSGVPSLLADLGGYQGESVWYNGTDSGGLVSNEPSGYSDVWPLCSFRTCVSAIVPFGDFNGDGYGDVLVRYRTGALRAYLGFGQSYYNKQVVKSIKLGTGWNAYNAFAAPGDLTGDGLPDLVARDGHGKLWLFASTGKGTFSARTRISGQWGGYARLVGAGDLTGDGVGDLLAIDKTGDMWLFAGNGHGGLLTRSLVSSGWSKYNTVIGIGDLNNDSCDDLVARDSHGGLWFFAGNCQGGFAKPTLINTGWQRYKALF